jgi:phosphoglycolate phosphatase-like HAD superfamily hydrolase
VTGNLERSAHTKLHRARLNRYFSFGGYASDSRDRDEVTRIALRKAALVYGAPLRAEDALVLGDTPHDVTSAHAAGIQCVGVASHQYDADQLRDAGADYVIESLEEDLPL